MDVIELMVTYKKDVSKYRRYLRYEENSHDDGFQWMGYLTAKGIMALDDQTGQRIHELSLSMRKMDANNPFFETGFIDGLLESSFSDKEIIEFIVCYLNLTWKAILTIRFKNNRHPRVWFYLMEHLLSREELKERTERAKVLIGIHHALSGLNLQDTRTTNQMLELTLRPFVEKMGWQEIPFYELFNEVVSHFLANPSVVVFRMVRAMRKWVDRETFIKIYEDVQQYDPVNTPTLLRCKGFRRVIRRTWPELRYIYDKNIKNAPSKPVNPLKILEVNGDYALVESSTKRRYLLKKGKKDGGKWDIVEIALVSLPRSCGLETIIADKVI